MTETDLCFEKCQPGMDCTSDICEHLGRIGCNGAQCVLMGKSGSEVAHCMSPMGPSPSPTSPPTPSPVPRTLGGFFVDSNHFKGDSFAGTRMISDMYNRMTSDRHADTQDSTIFLIGSDDGTTFWSLQGAWVDRDVGNLTVDFSPKGGPANLSGVCTNDTIAWEDGNAWFLLSKPLFAMSQAISVAKDMGGFYVDPDKTQSDTFAGARMISDSVPKSPALDLLVIGSNDGSSFFYLRGSTIDKASGSIFINSTSGGQIGTFRGDNITWLQSYVWLRQRSATASLA